MEIRLKPGDISQEEELVSLRNILFSRIDDASLFSINLEQTTHADLAMFNTLVALYVRLKRMNKRLVFQHCEDEQLKRFIQKTNFHHVFKS